MEMSQVHDYASQLVRLHGEKAQLVAAQRAIESERRGDHQEAEDWRRIAGAQGDEGAARKLSLQFIATHQTILPAREAAISGCQSMVRLDVGRAY